MTTATTRLGFRLAGAFAVGFVLAPVGAVVVVGAAFGGGTIAVAAGAVAVTVGGLVLGALHRATLAHDSRPGVGRSLGWGLSVTVVSAVLVLGCALAWSEGGRSFGGSPALWWALCGVGVALVAAAGTRPTALPAGAVVVALAVAAVTVSGVAVSGMAGPLRGQPSDDGTSGVRPSLVYVVDLPGFDDGQQTSGAGSPSIVYLPVGTPPLDGTGPDPSVLLTTEGAPAEDAPCGRRQQLPFDDADEATCAELAPGLFHREASRYHEVVRVTGDAVVSATASQEVSVTTLAEAVRAARPATDAELDRLYQGWGEP